MLIMVGWNHGGLWWEFGMESCPRHRESVGTQKQWVRAGSVSQEDQLQGTGGSSGGGQGTERGEIET